MASNINSKNSVVNSIMNSSVDLFGQNKKRAMEDGKFKNESFEPTTKWGKALANTLNFGADFVIGSLPYMYDTQGLATGLQRAFGGVQARRQAEADKEQRVLDFEANSRVLDALGLDNVGSAARTANAQNFVMDNYKDISSNVANMNTVASYNDFHKQGENNAKRLYDENPAQINRYDVNGKLITPQQPEQEAEQAAPIGVNENYKPFSGNEVNINTSKMSSDEPLYISNKTNPFNSSETFNLNAQATKPMLINLDKMIEIQKMGSTGVKNAVDNRRDYDKNNLDSLDKRYVSDNSLAGTKYTADVGARSREKVANINSATTRRGQDLNYSLGKERNQIGWKGLELREQTGGGLPTTVKNKLLTSINDTNNLITKNNEIIALVTDRPSSVGGLVKGGLQGNEFTNYLLNKRDPDGTSARLMLSDYRNMMIRFITGAQMSEKETARLMQQLPSKFDDAKTVKNKMKTINTILENQNTANFNALQNGIVPMQSSNYSTPTPQNIGGFIIEEIE